MRADLSRGQKRELRPHLHNDAATRIDVALLTPIVRRALARDDGRVSGWHVATLTPGAGAGTGGILRVSGTALAGSEELSWSVILKIITQGGVVTDPAAWNYRSREALLYRSGLLDDLAGGLTAPRCFGITDLVGGQTWLWLEDIVDADPEPWPLERHALAARHLGEMNGAYLVGKSLPNQQWLSRNALRGWVETFLPRHARLAEAEADAVVGPYCAADLSAGARRLAAGYSPILDALAQLPQTFQHGDAHRGNLFARHSPAGQAETVAIDWAFAGIRAVGEEVESLVTVASLFFAIEHEDINQLADLCITAYIEGLRVAGWHGNSDLARLGFLGAATVRFPLVPVEVLFLDAGTRAQFSAITGRSFDETIRRYQAVRRWGLAQEAETHDLLRRLL